MSSTDDPRFLNQQGMAALAAGRFAEAAGAFEQAAKLDASEPVLRINLATAYRRMGDEAGEQSALEAALALDARHFLANLRLAELFERQGLLSRAAPPWSAVVQLALGMESPRPPLAVDALARGQAFLERHNQVFAQAIAEELGDDFEAQDARRFRAAVDVMLGRRRVFANECHGVHYPFLPADEYFERRHFPWFDALESRTPAIRAEALALLASKDAAIRPYVRQPKGTPVNKWSPLDESLDWGACFLWEYGVRNEAVCAACPETAAALELAPTSHIPGKAPSAFFSILQPGAHIPPHTGVTNTRAIVHLPLVVPEGCEFRVGGETRAWREGEAFAFDDTIEHEAWNRSEHIRIVLIFDVWNPHLSAAEQERLARLFAIADRGLVAPRA